MSDRSAAVDLELTIRRAPAGYVADMRLARPGDEIYAELAFAAPVPIDLGALLALAPDPDAYGRALTAQVFHVPALREAWTHACGFVAASALPLRLHLNLDAKDTELHALRWETLRDPLDDTPLARSERLLLVRHLASIDTQPPKPSSGHARRALLVVASPHNLGHYGLAPLDVAGEVERVRQALVDNHLTVICAQAGLRATMGAIFAALREEPDILCLICHARYLEGDVALWLEDEAGQANVVLSRDFAGMIDRLSRRPLLAVLIAPQGGGPGRDDGALGALGPRLIQAGIRAVVAMQSQLSINASQAFLGTLFAELRHDGAIDRAVAAGRRILSNDRWWVPVLWLQMREGRLWQKEEVLASPASVASGVVDHFLQGLAKYRLHAREETRPDPEEHFEPRRFEAAMPRSCQQGLSTEVRCMVALSTSEGMRRFLPDVTESGDLISKDDVRGNETTVGFQDGELLTVVHVEVRAPDFIIDEPVQQLAVRRGADSGVATFFIEPRHPRPHARVAVRLFQDAQCEILLDALTLICEIQPPASVGLAIPAVEGNTSPPAGWAEAESEVHAAGNRWTLSRGKTMWLEERPVDRQRRRLEQHRATLAHYLDQLAIAGAAYARPEVTAGIREARGGIARAKAALAALSAPAEDLPDDTA